MSSCSRPRPRASTSSRTSSTAATLAARAAGVEDEAIAQALRGFEGVPHRLELVRELHGVRYVNDSKATNTAAARRAIEAYPESPLHLIFGGSVKGEDFAPLAAAIPERVRSIHLIGEAADDLARAFDAAGVAYDRDGDLAGALRHAHALAAAGDVVLLSPSTASFDQFENFEHRGDVFRELVGALT